VTDSPLREKCLGRDVLLSFDFCLLHIDDIFTIPFLFYPSLFVPPITSYFPQHSVLPTPPTIIPLIESLFSPYFGQATFNPD
jgi:hypothetical protein